MKLRLAISFLLVFAAYNIVYASRGEKINVAVMDLEISGDISAKYQKPLSDRLRQELFNTGKFKVFERNAMDKILAELSLPQSGIISEENAVEIGRLLGVANIILGSIAEVESEYFIYLRRVSVETGEILVSVNLECGGTMVDIMSKELRKTAKWLAKGKQPPKTSFSLGYGFGEIPLKTEGFEDITELLNGIDEPFILPADIDKKPFHSIHLEIMGRSNSYFLLELGEIPVKYTNIYFLKIGGGSRTYLTDRYANYIAPSIFFEGAVDLILFDLPDFPSIVEYDSTYYSGVYNYKSIEKKDPKGTIGFNLNSGFELKLVEHLVLQVRVGYFFALKSKMLEHTSYAEEEIEGATLGGNGVTFSGTISLAL